MGFKATGEKNWPTDVGALLRVGMTDALHMTGRALMKRVHDGMRQAKSGRVYGYHQASAPGEYSAIHTGELAASIDYRVGHNFLAFFATAPHAGYQEHGTQKMAARENLIRAIRESDGEIRTLIDLCIRRRLGV